MDGTRYSFVMGSTIVAAVRPVTSIAVAILLAFIVGAFVFKLLSGGLSP